ncbi:hypothetical protein BURPS305_3615 [Burkholderia pseudomallei 305]|nr:hypothetical protein BURPS305_3615 [Burkholderia pseudomallei 305]
MTPLHIGARRYFRFLLRPVIESGGNAASMRAFEANSPPGFLPNSTIR